MEYIINAIFLFLAFLVITKIPYCRNNRGELRMEADKQKPVVERTVVVNDTHVRVRSIFGDIPLEKVMANIAKRKLAQSKRNNKPR